MIPILYSKNETDFTHNGIGFLRDAIFCMVTEARNGVYEIVLQYPIEGQHHEYIEEGCYIKAKPNETSDLQLFKLYNSSKPIDGIVTWYGEHISYELNGNPVVGFSVVAASGAKAVQKALVSGFFEHKFTAWSDIATLNSTIIKEPTSVRAILGGVDNSILDIWGGEYEFDNYTVKLHANRGSDTGVVIEYGKNLTDIKQERNISAVYTALLPWAKYTDDNNVEHIITLSEKVIATPFANQYPHYKALILDLSEEFGENETPTEATLRAKANAYLSQHQIDVPKVSISVTPVQLWQTAEYKNIAPLERVKLCDTVTVRFLKLGINATAKVIKTEYDVLGERYTRIELGDTRSNFADTLNKQQSDINTIRKQVVDGQSAATIAWQNAIKNATNLITGNSGGYVVLHPAEMPQEILILDKPNIEEAVNVWRWNSSGLGYSKNGYNGEYALAMTMDGAIVADFITAGELNGIILKAGSVSAESLSVEFKKTIKDDTNKTAEIVTQEFRAADLELYSMISKTLENYETSTQVSSAINQTAESIMLEVNKKVNGVDFGTEITQNYNSVQIAWNNISRYIEFSGGAINIYQSTAQGTDNLLMKMNHSGAWYYYSGATIGKIGTNAWVNDSTFRGLVFDLEYESDYMCWAHKTSASASSYTVQLIYYANNKKEKQGLHFSANTYAWNKLYINENIRTINYSDGSGGLYSATHEVGLYGASTRLNGSGTIFDITKSKYTFYGSNSNLIDCYNNIDMHNWSILNQSDARLKRNIVPTKVNALNLINNIELKEYDWIDSGTHEEIGIIAQQLKELVPDLIDENAETGCLSIKTIKLIPYLIKAIQEISNHTQKNTWTDKTLIKDKKFFVNKNKTKNQLRKEIKSKKLSIPVKKKKE